MIYKVRLSNIWIFIPLCVILTLSVVFSLAFLFYGHLDRLVVGLIALPAFAMTFSLSALLSSRIKNIEFKEPILIIDNTKIINIQSIEWYNEDSNFLFDGFTIKIKDGEKFNLTRLALFNKRDDFKLLKDRILKRDSQNPNLIKIKHRELIDLKSIKYLNILSFIRVVLIVVFNIILAIFSDNLVSKIILAVFSLILISFLILRKKK